MASLFSSGQIVDFVFLVIVLEAGVLIVRHRLTGRGLSPGEIVAALIPGAFLMLAVRTALTGAWWGWCALALAASGIAHAADMAQRLGRGK